MLRRKSHVWEGKGLMICQSPEDFSNRAVLCMVGIYSSLFAGSCVLLIAISSSVLGFSRVYFVYLIHLFACILLSDSPLFSFSIRFYFNNCSYLNNVNLYFYSSHKMFIAICVYTYPALSPTATSHPSVSPPAMSMSPPCEFFLPYEFPPYT